MKFTVKCYAVLALLCQTLMLSAIEPVFKWSFETADGTPDTAGATFVGRRRGVSVSDGIHGKTLRVGVDKEAKNILSAAVRLPQSFGKDAGSVTFRVKPEGWQGSDKDFRNFIHLTNAAGESLSIYRLHNSDGTFIVTLMGKDGKRADAGFDMKNWQKDTWYNIAVCWDAEYIYIYQNGQLVRRSSVRGFKFTQPFNQLEIGKYLRTYNGGYMLMDDVMLYNGVLSDTEAKEATAEAKGEGVIPVQPVFSWSFETADGTPDTAGATFVGQRRGVSVSDGIHGKTLRVGVDKEAKNILSAAVRLPQNFGKDAGSVTFRVKPEGWLGSDKDFRNFIHLTNAAGESLSIYRLHNSDGTFIVTLMGKDGKRADAGFDMKNWQKDTWYNIAVCWDAEYIYIYQNGQLVRRSSVRGFKFTQPFNQLEIGKYLRTYNGGYMLMDDIMLYNGVLSDTEAKEATAPVTPGIRSGATRVTIDEASKQLSFKVPGSDKIFSTAGKPLFAFRLYDETARRDNDKPLNGTGHFWGTNLVMSGQEITSNDCELLKIEYKTADSAVLFFKHPAAEVELTIIATATGVKSFAKITNTGDTPIYEFTVLPFSFQLGEGENVITPFPPHIGIEFSKVISYKWAMNYAWDGFLVREGSGFLAVDRYQDIETLYLPGWGTVTGGENNTLSFLGTTLIFIRKGESRTSIGLSVRHFADIKSWADNYRQLNFPRGMKTLAEKLTKDQFDKFSRAYLAPTWATIRNASALVATAPGTFIVHPPIYMHACKGIRSNWDAFPNYFPPIARVGTMDEFAALIRQIVDSGNLFMPRNSFYYWGVGSDYAERYDLERSAIVRIDGKPRTAMWAQPGYMVSPSSRDVLAHLEEIYQRWISMGTNAYFTNVIGAQLPDHNAFDFHPDAPAPDAFYTQLFNIHKLHGTRIPLMSEHGAFWIMPYQVGICGVGGWLRPLPGNLEPKGTVVRSAPEVCLTLMHEYIRFYTSNTGYLAAPAGPRGIAYSLTHGIGLKAGFLNDFEMTREKRRWMRTTALIAGEIHSLNYGQPLDSYTDKDGVITAVYGGNLNIANFSDKPLAMQAGEYSTVIAPEGFLFVSKDHNRIAGYFTEFAGNKFAEPVLLVVLKKGETIEVYAPLQLEATNIELAGVKAVIPAYPAVIAPKVPGIRINTVAKTFTADPVVADTQKVPRYGQDQVVALPTAVAGSEAVLQWSAGENLPPVLQSLSGMVTAAGLRITAPQELTFNNIAGKIVVEIGIVLNRYPEETIQPDLWNILSSGNNFKLSFNSYTGRVHFQAAGARQVSTWGMSFEPRKYNMIKVVLDGSQQLVDFNGVTGKSEDKPLFPAGESKWVIGYPKCDFTITSIRVSVIK